MLKKRIILLLIGFSPLLVGYILRLLPMAIPTNLLTAMSPLFWALWFAVSWFCMKFFTSKLEVIMLLNIGALLFFFLAYYQAFILVEFWLNQIGTTTLLFYMPLLRLPFVILSSAFPAVDQRFVYFIAIGFLVLASSLGTILGKRYNNKGE